MNYELCKHVFVSMAGGFKYNINVSAGKDDMHRNRGDADVAATVYMCWYI